MPGLSSRVRGGSNAAAQVAISLPLAFALVVSCCRTRLGHVLLRFHGLGLLLLHLLLALLQLHALLLFGLHLLLLLHAGLLLRLGLHLQLHLMLARLVFGVASRLVLLL